MSLEQAIHEQWRRDPTLAAHLPPERLATGPHLPMTGPAAGVALPYATLEPAQLIGRQRMSPRVRLETASVKFRVWAETLDELKQLADLIARCFERKDFRAGQAAVLDMRLTQQTESRQEDGIWRLESTFLTRIESKEKP